MFFLSWNQKERNQRDSPNHSRGRGVSKVPSCSKSSRGFIHNHLNKPWTLSTLMRLPRQTTEQRTPKPIKSLTRGAWGPDEGSSASAQRHWEFHKKSHTQQQPPRTGSFCEISVIFTTNRHPVPPVYWKKKPPDQLTKNTQRIFSQSIDLQQVENKQNLTQKQGKYTKEKSRHEATLCDPCRIQTCNPHIRSVVLYSVELMDRNPSSRKYFLCETTEYDTFSENAGRNRHADLHILH